MDELAFSEVFGLMIEDAVNVNVINEKQLDQSELDVITEVSNETDSLRQRSTFKSYKTKKEKELSLLQSIIESIPDELSRYSTLSE